jgi:hypothetical protein
MTTFLHTALGSGVAACSCFDLPKIGDERGNLTFVEASRHVPFAIRRVDYLYDVPGGSVRAGHAHKTLEQVLIAVAGSFDVRLDDGHHQVTCHFSRADQGLYIAPMVWRELGNFSSGSCCLALASDVFLDEDYYRDHAEFLRAAGASRC